MYLLFLIQTFSVEDTDIDCIREEIDKAKQVIHDLNNLQHGVVKDPLLSILREVSIAKYQTCLQILLCFWDKTKAKLMFRSFYAPFSWGGCIRGSVYENRKLCLSLM